MLKEKLKKNRLILDIYILFCKFLTILSPTLNTKVTFLISKGTPLNLRNPKTLDEKISWLKLYKYRKNQLVTQCADKYEVRRYVSDKGLSNILNDLYFTYKSPKKIRLDDLPDKFAMKWNMGAGGNFICKDKSKIDEMTLRKLMKKNKIDLVI